MATKNLPQADGCAMNAVSVAQLRASVGDLHDDMAYRLGAMLSAARLLAVHQRIYEVIKVVASVSPNFNRELSALLPAWQEPDADGADADTLPELLRVARNTLADLVARAEKISEAAAIMPRGATDSSVGAAA